MDAGSGAIAELGMYPFESVRWAWDALWTAVAARVEWLPPMLAHSGDVHARWADASCIVNHVCGWPLATQHADVHRVVGSFSLTIPEAGGHRYRSTIVSKLPTPLAELDLATTRAAVNHDDSLSGHISLLAAAGVEAWPGPVTVTGAHVESLRALQGGDADVACIDSWSLRLIEREQPDAVLGLHPVGFGPIIPTPAVTVRGLGQAGEAAAESIGNAMIDAIDHASAKEIRTALMIDGFVRTTIDDYLPVLRLLEQQNRQQNQQSQKGQP